MEKPTEGYLEQIENFSISFKVYKKVTFVSFYCFKFLIVVTWSKTHDKAGSTWLKEGRRSSRSSKIPAQGDVVDAVRRDSSEDGRFTYKCITDFDNESKVIIFESLLK